MLETQLVLTRKNPRITRQINVVCSMMAEAYDLERPRIRRRGFGKVVVEYSDAPEPRGTLLAGREIGVIEGARYWEFEGIHFLTLPWDGSLPEEGISLRAWCAGRLHAGFSAFLHWHGLDADGTEKALEILAQREYACLWVGAEKHNRKRKLKAMVVAERTEDETRAWLEVHATDQNAQVARLPIDLHRDADLCEATRRAAVVKWMSPSEVRIEPKMRFGDRHYPDVTLSIEG